MVQRGAGLRAVPSTAAIAFALAAAIMAGLVAVATGLFDASPEETAVLQSVQAIAAESTAVADNYFAGPEAVAQVVANGVARDLSASSHVDLLRDLTISQPNVAGVFIGYPDGSFVDVRDNGDEQIRIKTIEIMAGERSVTTDIVDSAGQLIDSFPSFDDTYDPRARPWFAGASEDDQHWTEPYVFFSSQLPGITHSVAIESNTGEISAVVGVDIRLDNLETFLHARRPSENGGAALLTSEGELIAGQTPLAFGGADHAVFEQWRDDSARDALLRVPGDEKRIASITEVGAQGERLFVVDAPEADFLGDVRANRRDLALLSSILGIVALSLMVSSGLAIRRYVQKLDRLAKTDSLTGLMNRASLYDNLTEVLEGSSSVTVMMIDVDNFKLINDQFGHRTGDQALSSVADRMLRAAPRDALVARLGGDEFCIVVHSSDSPDVVCKDIILAVSGTVFVDGHTFELELSAGYVSATGTDRDLSQLLHHADLAMYASKSEPGTVVNAFTDQLLTQFPSDRERRRCFHDIPFAQPRAA